MLEGFDTKWALPGQEFIRSALDKASRLVAPAFVYSIYEIAGLERACARLSNG
jgi:hypothetical protein